MRFSEILNSFIYHHFMDQNNLDAETAYQLILNLTSTNEQKRDESIKLIPQIASLLGPERTIIELIPYIINSAVHTEKSLCSSILQFINFDFQYTREQFIKIFDSISPLFEIDMKSIRKAVVKFITSICGKIDREIVNEIIPNKITTFLEADLDNYSFPISIQMVGVRLTASIFNLLSDECQKNVLTDFINFANPQNPQNSSNSSNPPLVQREIIKACVKLVKYTNDERLFRCVQKHTKDESPTIAYSIPKFIINYLSKEGSEYATIKVLIRGLSRSPNWRIKCKLFMSMKEMNDIKPFPGDLLVDIFNGALNRKDEDEEVRIAEAQQIGLLPKENEKTMEIVTKLLKDSCPHVRTAAMESISNSQDKEFVKDQLISLLKDSVREVRSAALDSLRTINISNDDISAILTNFLDSGEAEWREKNDIVNIFVEKNVKNIDLFKKLIFDDAFEVRNSLLVNIPKLDYSDPDLLQVVKEAVDDEDYQIRQMVVLIIIIKKLYNDESGLELLKKLAEDKVSNVRLIVAKYTPRNLQIISKLTEDPDEDVRDFASSACSPVNSIKKQNVLPIYSK
ncbi:hypothetical protein M9Y10_009652 [Tritrichomonas musculus]|uniref:HEAT repeat family protein n=1 Tax=Tritrichomonas musculus TaxID=1915356 RepID=A0ABR2IQ47_9EUKA